MKQITTRLAPWETLRLSANKLLFPLGPVINNQYHATYNSKCIFRANKQKHSQVNACQAQLGMLTCLMDKAKLILLLNHIT